MGADEAVRYAMGARPAGIPGGNGAGPAAPWPRRPGGNHQPGPAAAAPGRAGPSRPAALPCRPR